MLDIYQKIQEEVEKKEGIGERTEETLKQGDNNKSVCLPGLACLHCGYHWRPKISNPK